MSATITVRAMTTSDEAAALAPAWQALLERSTTNVLFLTPAFQSLWWEYLGRGERRLLVGQTADGQPRFVAPLYLSDLPDLGRTVRVVGGSEVADYLDIVAAPEDLESAWRQLFGQLESFWPDWQTIDLRALPAWSPTRQIAQRLAAEAGWSAVESVDEVCPLIQLAPTWEGYLAGLRKKDRHELRRKIGRLERLATSECFELIERPADLPAAIEDFLRLHRLSGQQKHDFWNERLERFFRRLIAVMLEQGWLRLTFQTIDGVRAATVLSFRYGERYYVYNSGYDPAYRELGAGVVCMGRTIQTAIAEGATIFDLLQGNESYKYDFGAVDTTIYRCVLQRRP